MTDQPITVGDVITVTVMKSVPFGVLVEYAGVPGLVPNVTGEPGADLTVRVAAYDQSQRRFAASAA